MLIKAGKAVVIPIFLLALMIACTEKTADPQTHTPATTLPEPVAAPAPKPLSMRVTDARLKIGATQNKSCNIESANGMLFWPDQPKVSRTNTIDIGGWVIDELSKTIPANVKIRLQTANGVLAWEQDIVTRLDRRDVAMHYNEDVYLKSGFKVSLDVVDFAPGDYVVYLTFDSPAGEAICGIGRRFTITP